MQQRSPLERIEKTPEKSIQKTPEVFSVTDQFLFDATTSPEVVAAFKSSPDEKVSCKAIADALQIMLVKKDLGIFEQWKLDIMAMMIYERLSSN
ncbi:MAG: hypothetical protein WC783_05515 [Candidatus Paceibacterota bacterium]|jgi:hypothetical protein